MRWFYSIPYILWTLTVQGQHDSLQIPRDSVTSQISTLLLSKCSLFCKVQDGCWSLGHFIPILASRQAKRQREGNTLPLKDTCLNCAYHFCVYYVYWLDLSHMVIPSCKRGWSMPYPQVNLRVLLLWKKGKWIWKNNQQSMLYHKRYDLLKFYPVTPPDKALKIWDLSEVTPRIPGPQIFPKLMPLN